MSDSSTELGLQLAVDADDTADYLTIGARQSFQTLDGLFSQASGHTHSGPHQGGTINGNAFGGPFDLPDWFRSTGQRSGFPTAGQGLEMYWSGVAGVLQSYDRAAGAYRDLMLFGSTIELNIGGAAALSIGADKSIVLPGVLTATGGINANGGVNLGNVMHALNHAIDGVSALSMQNGANLGYSSTDHIQVNNSLDTTFDLTVGRNLQVNGTYNSPGGLTASSVTSTGLLQVNGNATVNGTTHAQAMTCTTLAATGALTAQNGLGVPTMAGGSQEHIEHGLATINGVGNNSGANQAVTFTKPFATNPVVIAALGTVTGGDIENWESAAQNISTTGFNARVYNSSGGTGNAQVYWLAIGA
jgi:hypothetical protein